MIVTNLLYIILDANKNATAMSTRTRDVPVVGKGNSVVPVNFPEHLDPPIEFILKMQDRLGMENNPYLFGKYGTQQYRNSRGYFSKQLDALNLSHVSKNLGSQGLRRARATEVMVGISTSCLSDHATNHLFVYLNADHGQRS